MKIIIDYALEVALALLSAGFLYLVKKLKDNYKSLVSTTKGVEALLKSHIVEKYTEYKTANCMSFYQKEILDEMYQEYKNLGGNGIAHKLMDEISEIPILNCEDGEK